MRTSMKILMLMALMLPPDLLAADLPPTGDCRRDDTPDCRAQREAICKREIEKWPDKFAQSRQSVPGQEAATQRALAEARERIAASQRKQVPACQTLYELNGGRDPCKHSDTAECQVEKQRRCSTAIDGYLEQVAQIDQTVPPQDAARGSMVAKFKQRVRDNRKAGVAECQTWGDLMKMAATQ